CRASPASWRPQYSWRLLNTRTAGVQLSPVPPGLAAAEHGVEAVTVARLVPAADGRGGGAMATTTTPSAPMTPALDRLVGEGRGLGVAGGSAGRAAAGLLLLLTAAVVDPIARGGRLGLG